jgi:hypothetical protein
MCVCERERRQRERERERESSLSLKTHIALGEFSAVKMERLRGKNMYLLFFCLRYKYSLIYIAVFKDVRSKDIPVGPACSN